MAKTAKAKTKIDNQAIASGDCRQAIHWYTNWLGQQASQSGAQKPVLSSARGLFASNFEADDQLLLEATLTNLQGQGISPLVIKGEQLYQQADQIWRLALEQAKYGEPAISQFETDMKNCQLLVLGDLSTPISAQQLWYFYHYVLYPRALIGKPLLISTPLGFDEFVMFGAGCDDFEYAGRRLTWEKVVWLLSATTLNLSYSKLLQAENLPVMLQPEYRLFRALQERHLNVTPQQIVGKQMLDLAISDQSSRTKINIECDLVHKFNPQQKERDTALTKEGWQVLRFSYKEITGDLEGCASAVEELCTGSAKKSTAGRCHSLSMFNYKVNLPVKDKEQLNAITHSGGPAAITGGAGTGKSTCIAQRIAFLVSQGVSPERILMISHSPQTVQLIKSAVGKLIAEPMIDRLNFYTWHDLGLRIVKEHVSAIKRKLPLKIESNPLKILQKLIAKHSKELDSTALELCGELDEAKAASMIALYKANLVSPQLAKEHAKTEAEKLLARVYSAYEEQLQKSNKIDKDDMISLAAQLLGQDIEVRTLYEGLFEHVMVDEYQDASAACDFLARILAFPNDNIIIVGNEDEAMFASSGAAPGLLSETSIRLPEASCYNLQKNWRSHPEITRHAEQFASYMAQLSIASQHVEKKTISGWGAAPTTAIFGPYAFVDQMAEGDWIADQIANLLAQGRKPDDIAVICRSEEQLSELQLKFSERGLMVSSASQDPSLVPDESADVIAFLKLVVDPDGPKAREYFERICQLRSKTVAPKLSATIAGFAEANNLSYLKAVEIYSEAVADPICQDLEQLVKIIRAMHQNKLPPAQIINLLKRPQWLGGYYKAIKVMPGIKYEPLQTIGEMHDEALSYRTVADFLKNYSPPSNLHHALESDQAVLNLLSIADTKGREFQVVFLPSLADGIFPDYLRPDQEEERRIFYICLTRARELLFLSCPRMVNDQEHVPSLFLEEAGLIEKTDTIRKGALPVPAVQQLAAAENVSEPIQIQLSEADSVDQNVYPPEFSEPEIQSSADEILEVKVMPPVAAENVEPQAEIVEDDLLDLRPLKEAVARSAGAENQPLAGEIVGADVRPPAGLEIPEVRGEKEFIANESGAEIIEEFMARPVAEANQNNLELAVHKVRQAKLDQNKKSAPIPPERSGEQPIPAPSLTQGGPIVPEAEVGLGAPPVRAEKIGPPALLPISTPPGPPTKGSTETGLPPPPEPPTKPFVIGPMLPVPPSKPSEKVSLPVSAGPVSSEPSAPAPNVPPPSSGALHAPVSPLSEMNSSTTSPQCNNCQAPLDADVRFCGECGADQTQVIRLCKSCGSPLEDQSKFCGECGAAQ